MQFLALFGLLISVLIVLGATYLSIRRFRPHLSVDAFRRLFTQRLIRTAGWAVGAYAVSFILLVPLITLLFTKVLHIKVF
jgi:hypothetical protein